jgi:hypothetical protein
LRGTLERTKQLVAALLVKARAVALVSFRNVLGEVRADANTVETAVGISLRAEVTRVGTTAISLTSTGITFYVIAISLALAAASTEEIVIDSVANTEEEGITSDERATRSISSSTEELDALAINADSVRTANINTGGAVTVESHTSNALTVLAVGARVTFEGGSAVLTSRFSRALASITSARNTTFSSSVDVSVVSTSIARAINSLVVNLALATVTTQRIAQVVRVTRSCSEADIVIITSACVVSHCLAGIGVTC